MRLSCHTSFDPIFFHNLQKLGVSLLFISLCQALAHAVYMTDIDDKASLIVSSSESQKVCQYRAVPDTACQYWSAHFLSVSRLFDILSQHLMYQDNLTHFLSGVSRCCSTPMGGFTLPLAKLHIRRLK